MSNADIAEYFTLLSKLMDINGENSFKSKTYAIAAFHIEKLEFPLAETNRSEISGIRGLGGSVTAKVIELLDTGSIAVLQQLIENTPAGVQEMLKIKGLGPKKINTVWKDMGIESLGELEYACNENRLTNYKGFGEKTQNNVLESIKFFNQNNGHFLYAQVELVFPLINDYLVKLFGNNNVLPTGDYRRQMTTIKELEFVVRSTKEEIKQQFQTAYPPEMLEENEDNLLYKLNNGLRLRIYFDNTNILFKQFETSCSIEFLDAFYEKLNKNIFENTQFKNEEEVFSKAGLSFVPVFLRETKDIIEKAASGVVPEILTVRDIRGIIHNHSKWSDGMNAIEELANELIKNNFEYLVISDHSKTAFYANGLSEERILKQHEEIDILNKRLSPFKIFKSIESDILGDGSLDYNNDILKTFDLVIASVHSNLSMTEEKAMKRLITAIENPFTTILGHPTGRLLLSRNGYPINHKKIIEACAANKVVIEINANPHRLDLDWQWINYAIEKGVLLSIDPDAHSLQGLYDIKYGVLAAQKGGLKKEFNLSSFDLAAFEDYLKKTKAAKQ